MLKKVQVKNQLLKKHHLNHLPEVNQLNPQLHAVHQKVQQEVVVHQLHAVHPEDLQQVNRQQEKEVLPPVQSTRQELVTMAQVINMKVQISTREHKLLRVLHPRPQQEKRAYLKTKILKELSLEIKNPDAIIGIFLL